MAELIIGLLLYALAWGGGIPVRYDTAAGAQCYRVTFCDGSGRPCVAREDCPSR